ncbi:hypothetical protein LOD99_13722 [Oopsacas minuta]|uniref:CYTH domain-containing protein n=1 Tax=Oopsacas minuta TaxID=111878 RepID=A0AAV7KKW9_9METZ|nr:hypothetical protein LOD99_13722 [Oopsacas minuta]
MVFEHVRLHLNRKTKSEGTQVLQRDTFYHSSKGILKLREQQGRGRSVATLIFYEKPADTASKQCHYTKSPIQDPISMKEILSKTLLQRGEVTKERLLYFIGQTHVRLDKVEGIGYFLELEIVMKPDQSRKKGVEIAESLLIELQVDSTWLQTHAYMDIIETNHVNAHWS